MSFPLAASPPEIYNKGDHFMSGKFDFDSAASCTEDALNLIDAVDELLSPLTQTGEPDASDLYDIKRRARMIDSTLRAARRNTAEALSLFRAADVEVDIPA